MSNFPDYKPFNVASARTDIQQLYVGTADHKWIKQQSTDHKVRMVTVVATLVNHAQTSDALFKQLLRIIKAQDTVLAQGGLLSEKTTDEVQKLLEQYGE